MAIASWDNWIENGRHIATIQAIFEIDQIDRIMTVEEFFDRFYEYGDLATDLFWWLISRDIISFGKELNELYPQRYRECHLTDDEAEASKRRGNSHEGGKGQLDRGPNGSRYFALV